MKFYTQRLSYLLVFVLIPFFNCFGQKPFPDYKEVVQKFFALYDVPEGRSAFEFRFIKQDKGYFVIEFDKTPHHIIQKNLFWSAEKGRYLKLDYLKNGEREDDAAEALIENYEANLFDLYPFYGYINWYHDVIEYLNTRDNLSEDEIYALGRAYSNAASALLNNNFKCADSSIMSRISERNKCQLSQNKIDEYLIYRHMAIEKFTELCARNSNYKTAVGNICNKRDNEVMTGFMELQIYQNEQEAKKEIKQNLYGNIYEELAIRFLSCCESDAILFTFGENETFPLLYIQSKGFRTDVLVVNLQMLSNTNYMNHLKFNNTFNAGSISLMLPIEFYSDNKLQFIPIRNQFQDSIFFTQLIQTYFQKNNEASEKNQIFEIPTRKVNLVIDSNQIVQMNLLRNYLSKEHFIALDIIQSNISERPIYFTGKSFPGIDKNLELNGYVFKLIDNKTCTDITFNKQCIKTDFTYQKVFEEFSIDFLSDTNRKPGGEIKFFQYPYIYLASYYAAKKQKDSCASVIDRYCKIFPNNIVEMDYLLLPLIESAYHLELDDKLYLICNKVIDNILLKSESDNLGKDEKRLIEFTIREIEKFILGNEELELKILRIKTRI